MHVFDSAFADVNEHFSTLVTSLFPGGTGRLSLTEPENLLDTGVEIEVRPAGRNVRRLSLLSGGERSLVAMAFLFAVFRSRPSPFYLMDEVEAALDDVNLQRFLGLVHEFREGAQLIIVSHQKRTMEAADALYGVTMAPGGSSKVVSQKVPRQREDGLDWSDRDSGSGAPTASTPAVVGSSSAATDGSSRDGSSSPPEAASSAPMPVAIPEVPVDPVEDPWNDDPWDQDSSAAFDEIESGTPGSSDVEDSSDRADSPDRSDSPDGSDSPNGSDASAAARDWADFTDPTEDDVLEGIVDYTGDGTDADDRRVDPTPVDRIDGEGVEVDRTEDAEDDSVDGGIDRTGDVDRAADGTVEDDGEGPVDGRIGGETRDLGGGRHPGMWVEDRIEAEPVGGADT